MKQRNDAASDLWAQMFERAAADALAKPQSLRARAVPPVGGTVGTVVPGKVFVQEIAEGLFGTHKRTRAGKHQTGSKAGNIGNVGRVIKLDRRVGRGRVFTVPGSNLPKMSFSMCASGL